MDSFVNAPHGIFAHRDRISGHEGGSDDVEINVLEGAPALRLLFLEEVVEGEGAEDVEG